MLEQLATTISPRVLRTTARTDEAARQLDEYFAGRRKQFDLAVDLRLVGGFRRSVLDHLRDIAYGQTESYAQVARAAGNAGAVRAAGSACSHNPVPVVVPCHRVLAAGGAIGGFSAPGSIVTKRELLALEHTPGFDDPTLF